MRGRSAGSPHISTFGSVFELSWLSGSDGFQINGEVAGDCAGVSVASAGDVNGDGFDDMIIGAYGADLNNEWSGATYVVFGSDSGFNAELELSHLDGTNGFRINGEAWGDSSGCSVSSADVNGDGLGDVIIGASAVADNGASSGACYVLFGSADGFDADLELSDLDGTNGFQINGSFGNWFGHSVSSAGDVNDDGYDDLIAGAAFGLQTYGASWVVFGAASGFADNFDASWTDLSPTKGFRIYGVAARDRAGNSVASAGDVNGDGFDDMIIGAYGVDTNGEYSGAAYVVFGAADGFSFNLDLFDLDGSNGFKINGVAAGDRSGRSVASAGDVNGDGFDDLIIGAYLAAANGVNSGASYVVFGAASAFEPSLNLSTLNGTNGFQIDGGSAGDGFGRSVASAGDVNGDGFDDVIIGAMGGGSNGAGFGAAYVVFGTAGGFDTTLELSDLDGTNGFKVNGDASGEWVGFSVAAAGDVNDDGFDDLIIGTRNSSPNGLYSGAAFIIYGKATKATTGDDELTCAGGAETINGLSGEDTVLGMAGNDQLFGDADEDSLDGGTGNDTLDGGADSDTLVGGGGNDWISGASGLDTIFGGSGSDTVIGYTGSDVLTGGADSDVFEFISMRDMTTRERTTDVITDFRRGQDKIDLSDIDASTVLTSDDAFLFRGKAAIGTIRAGEVSYKQFDLAGKKNDYTLVYIDTDGDRAAEGVIKVMGLHNFTAGDFIL